eukprot:jgi/Galph1/329/GphlegSOOS_G5033.1
MQERILRGAVVFCLGTPKNLQIGIDWRSFEAPENLEGFKGVPPGIHFLFFSANDVVRSGICFQVSSGDIVVFRWDAEQEHFNFVQILQDEEKRKGFLYNTQLAIFPEDVEKEWKQLTSCITKELLELLNIPLLTSIHPGEVDLEEIYKTTLANSLVLATSEGYRTPVFTSIPNERRRSSSMTPAEVTKFNLDASERLESCLKYYQESLSSYRTTSGLINNLKMEEMAVLGEQQLAFVLFMLLFSLPALEQWKKLTNLLCCCDDILFSRPRLFFVFAKNLRMQLKVVPRDLFTDELSADNFLCSSLERLFDTVDESTSLDASLKRSINKLKSVVISDFDWNFKQGETIFTSGERVGENEPMYVPYEECAAYLSETGEEKKSTPGDEGIFSKTELRALNSKRSVESSLFQSRKSVLEQALDSVEHTINR